MKCFFSNPDFDFQMVRLLDSAKNQGADLSECLSTSTLIEEGNLESWYQKWMELAHQVQMDAEKKLVETHKESAAASFLRASNYYRQAYTFLYYENVDERILNAYFLQKECFQKAKIPFLSLSVPFEKEFFTANFYPSPTLKPSPTLIVNQGYEGNQQDSFFEFHQSCQAHGYNLLTFDGPGQGEQLIHKKFHLPLNWEKVITPILDKILEIKSVDPKKIALLGQSWGSLFASIGAAHDSRITSLILTPGVVDPIIGIERFLPDIQKKIDEKDSTSVNTLFAQAMCNKMVANKFKLKMLAHGVDSIFSLMEIYRNFNLREIANKIRCPTLIFDCPDDPLLKDQSKTLYDLISSKKKNIHSCQDEPSPSWGSLMTSGHQSLIFDWLDDTFQ